MNKRVFAWILLIAFVLLLLNILIFRVYWEFFMVVYIIILFAFIFSKGKLFEQEETSEHSEPDAAKDGNENAKVNSAAAENSTSDDNNVDRASDKSE